LPLVNREIKVIADSMVNREFGTGAVKVTPAHDPNDYVLGRKHNLDFINIMHTDGRLNENAGQYKDMERFQAREIVLKDLREKGLLEKVQPHKLSAGHCYRCHTIIEPYFSEQWFVKMEPLAEPAINVVKKGRIKFHPARWTKVYLNWMNNIQDWCISRQIWWGHRLPVYYCKKCQAQAKQLSVVSCQLSDKAKPVTEKGVIVSGIAPEKCPDCGSSEIYQDEDVLDTWFSSWLWPFATFYWPPEAQSTELRAQSQNDLNYFYPTSVLVTAPEILFFWVARMIMAGLEFMGDVPFKDVYIHGTVRDIRGKKMSKSLGNAIDPLEIISEYGTDALRFCLTSSASQGDLFLSREKFEMGRNFANKLWNASRFIMMNLTDFDVQEKRASSIEHRASSLADRWILSRFYGMLKGVNRNLNNYRFNEAANLLYAFLWHDFCDWYLEISKNNLKEANTQMIMYSVLERTLRLLHPFMPFITEGIWQMLPHVGESITIQPWPHAQEELIDKKLESEMDLVFEIIKNIRNLRSQIELKPDQKVSVSVCPHTKIKQRLIKENSDLIKNLAKSEILKILSLSRRPRATISATTEDVDIYLHFGGLIDISKEQQRIKEKIDSLVKIIKTKEVRIKNAEFVKKAPAEVVAKERVSIDKLKDESKRLEKMLGELY
jgi:valyl-tRNA synthetase